MKTLRMLAMSKLSLQDMDKVATDYTTIFGDEWEVWRQKASCDFGISCQFFDLVASVSGRQRYLQIKSYHSFSSELIYERKSGVFEPYAACEVFCRQGYLNLVNECTNKIPPLSRDPDFTYSDKFVAREVGALPEWVRCYHRLSSPETPLHMEDLYMLGYARNRDADNLMLCKYKLGRCTLEQLFIYTLHSNVKKGINKMARFLFRLPVGFNISDVPRRMYWQSRPKLDSLHETKQNRVLHTSYFLSLVLETCLLTGNIRMVDVIFYLYRDLLVRTVLFKSPLSVLSRDMEGTYTICYCYFNYVPVQLHWPELALLALERLPEGEAKNIALNLSCKQGAGNVPYIEAIACNGKFRNYLGMISFNKERYPESEKTRKRLTGN